MTWHAGKVRARSTAPADVSGAERWLPKSHGREGNGDVRKEVRKQAEKKKKEGKKNLVSVFMSVNTAGGSRSGDQERPD